MPYSLSEFYSAEWEMAFPESWGKRLREVSPITENTSHLRERYFPPHPTWAFEERGQWVLYACTPKRMVHPEKMEQLDKHWSELPPSEQPGRKACVSNYQHFMWHTRQVLAEPFLILQGDQGGTPAKYTEREKAYLRASHCLDEPVAIGFFPAVPFDERVVAQIGKRDRLLQACNRYDELEKMDRPEYLRAEDEAAEQLFRETYLDTMAVMLQPSVEFLQSAIGRKAMEEEFRPAPEGTADAVAQWKDHWQNHGVVVGSKVASMRKRNFAVR